MGCSRSLPRSAGIALWTSLARRTSLDSAKIQNAGLLAVLCIVIGARLAVVIDNWQGFLQAPLLILMAGTLSTGSAVIFGVLLAAIVAIAYLLLARVPVIRALDAAAPAVMLALAILDIADFAAGSHYGAPTSVPWGVTYSSRFAARTAGVPLGIRAASGATLCGRRALRTRRSPRHDAASRCPEWRGPVV